MSLGEGTTGDESGSFKGVVTGHTTGVLCVSVSPASNFIHSFLVTTTKTESFLVISYLVIETANCIKAGKLAGH